MTIGGYRLTRDSVLWWFGIIGAIVVGLAANLDLFPWFSETAQRWISLAAFVIGIVSGKLATSPLKGENDPPAGAVNLSRVEGQ